MNFRLDVLALLCEYPLLIPTNGYKKWEGFLSINDCQVKTVINVPNYPQMNNVTWELPPHIEKEIANQKEGLSNSNTLTEFLKTLTNTISENLKNSTRKIENVTCWNEQNILIYKQLLIDLDKCLNLCHIEEIGEDFTWIKIGYRDSHCYNHNITLSLNFKEQKVKFKIISHDLPIDAVTVLSEIFSLDQFFSKLEEIIESLIPFWNMCKELEEKTWIMDPATPKRSDTHRRIYLAEDLSVLLKFNPFNITSLPEVKFLGSVNSVNNARNKFQNGLEIYDGWDNDLTVLENLERLLDIQKFLSKEQVEIERNALGVSSDCLICYITLSEQPVKYCLNEKCSALFHLSCLLRWFETSQTSGAGPNYDYLRVPCPCCENILYCPRMPTTSSGHK
ncbi:hypothetical protein O3M35_007410 [Rhynocoris fuscipes]|uniref:RING-type domain-containing protein n=1 Tax=Rhynocoris fuscipes TaxID=488301 RepID=A0AAW1D9Z3_9HEMI